MSFPSGTLQTAPNLRTRPSPDVGGLLVFTPLNPNVYFLNYTTWTIFELCEGRTERDAREAFCEFMSGIATPEEANAAFDKGLTSLQTKGIIVSSA